MGVRLRAYLGVAVLGVSLLGACGEDEADNGTTGVGAELADAPAAVKLINGRRFKLIRAVKARRTRKDDGEARPAGPTSPGRPLEEMTVEELETAIRGRHLHAGYEYQEGSAIDRAVIIHDHLHGRAPLAERVRNGRAPAQVAQGAADDMAAFPAVIDKVVIGTDTRTVRGNTTQNGSRNMVLTTADVTLTATSDSICTAQLIGQRTGLSAAHCFWDSVAGDWFDDYAWAAGFDSQDADIDPFGQGNRCYGVTIPGGFGAGDPIEHDYAVMDFFCGTPGAVAGWWGTKVPDVTNTQIQQTFNIWGYPTRDINGTTQNCGNPAVPCNTRLWGSSGTLAVGSPAYIINYSIDTSPAMSGSAVWRFFDGQEFTVAIHSRGSNQGRRIDATVNTAIDDWSAEY